MEIQIEEKRRVAFNTERRLKKNARWYIDVLSDAFRYWLEGCKKPVGFSGMAITIAVLAYGLFDLRKGNLSIGIGDYPFLLGVLVFNKFIAGDSTNDALIRAGLFNIAANGTQVIEHFLGCIHTFECFFI